MECKECGTRDQVLAQAQYCASCLQAILSSHHATRSPVEPPKSMESSGMVLDMTASDKNGWLLKGSLPLNGGGRGRCKEVRKVSVVKELEQTLKSYQKKGVEFIWGNCFSDCNYYDRGDQSVIGGCILAHYMGLGKSLTTITVLHTALKCPSLVSSTTRKQPLFHTVLMLAPANTLTNWEDEVEKWTGKLHEPLTILNLSKVQAGYRPKELKKWKRDGGLLVMSDSLFLKLAKTILDVAQPDVLVVDEAHTMLAKASNKVFQHLSHIQTKRRILLTGTPLQNNVTEYFHMVEFIRPGVIGASSEADFERVFREPIEGGLPSDATNEDKLISLEKQVELNKKLDPFVDRKSAAVLRQQLPPIYDTLLSLHPSRIQMRLINIDKRQRDQKIKDNNFFRQYAAIAPVLNHPGCLKVAKRGKGKELSWKTPDEAGDEWFMNNGGLKKAEFEKMHEVKKSPKLIILAHILAMAVTDEDKVLVYSKDLTTLDIIEWFLSSPDWKKHVHSLRLSFPHLKLGGWKKGKDYLRIDGSIESGKRGCLVDKFNNDGQIKVFTISSLAGGIGINLCSASVVVIFDNHFNPSISDQCISRAHRLGQAKPVHCYRLAIQGSMESKVYFRSVNKSGVAMQVVDGQFSEKRFSTEELEDLRKFSTTVFCQRCLKTRLLPPLQDPPDEDEEWYCEMNQDLQHNACAIPEADFKHGRVQSRAAEDPVLQHLLGVVNKGTMRKEIVADHLPVEIVHQTDVSCEDAIAKLKQDIAGHKEHPGKRGQAAKAHGQPKDDNKAKPKERAVERFGAAAKAHGQPKDDKKAKAKEREVEIVDLTDTGSDQETKRYRVTEI